VVKLVLDKGGQILEAEIDVLLVAVGRTANLENCGLEQAKVQVEKGRIVVDEWGQTSVPGVYAIGDLVRGAWLAHKASAEGVIAAERIAGHPSRPLDYQHIPGATYCRPEVASVGLTEQAAREAGHDVAVGKFPWAASGKARILGETVGFIKIVRETRYDEILGVHIIGPRATDLISEACVLLGLEATAEELGRIVHPHPTLGEAMMEAGHAASGHSLSI
jgi:dihydrolipoamide dehydrogenase